MHAGVLTALSSITMRDNAPQSWAFLGNVSSSVRQLEAQPGSAYWTQGTQIITNAWDSAGRLGQSEHTGVEVRINGVSWSGFESQPCVLGGLGVHDARD